MIITQRYPKFMTGFSIEEAEVNSQEDFDNIKFVKQWASDPKFSRFSISRKHQQQKLLMVEMKDESFWAIGYIKGNLTIELPEWEKSK